MLQFEKIQGKVFVRVESPNREGAAKFSARKRKGSKAPIKVVCSNGHIYPSINVASDVLNIAATEIGKAIKAQKMLRGLFFAKAPKR